MKKRKLGQYFELPCYPDTVASASRALVVSIHDRFCGSLGSTVFIGGGGVAQRANRSQAAEAIPELVRHRLEERVHALREHLKYAEAQLAAWNKAPQQFAREPRD